MSRRWGELSQLAIECECTVPKLGNVYPGAPFADMDIEAFRLAARTIRIALEVMPEEDLRSVGKIVLRSVQAMMRSPGVNTSLGTILLFAPLVVAGETLITRRGIDWKRRADEWEPQFQRLEFIRTHVVNVLNEMTADDSAMVYEAITLASPGGIGESPKMDVALTPPDRLLDAMQFASSYDDVALQYVTRFELVFQYAERLFSLSIPNGVPEGLPTSEWINGIRELQLSILSERNDSLIARKGGIELATEVRTKAHRLWMLQSENTQEQFANEWLSLDRWMRSQVSNKGKQIANPGTTADLIAAAIFVRLWSDTPRG